MKLVDDVKQFVSVLRKMLRRKESKRVEFGSTEAEGNLEHLGGRNSGASKRVEFGSTQAEGIREHPRGWNSGAPKRKEFGS